MDRSVLSAVLRGVLGLGSLVAFGFVWPWQGDPSSAAPPPKGDNGWRLLNPVTYENISIFPVVSGSEPDTSGFLSLDEGLASGEVVVRERGTDGMIRNRGGVVQPQSSQSASVNQLVLIDNSKHPLLLLAGELVSGGKQDRIIGKDRIVPVGAPPLPLDVFCVERGRWSQGSKFAAAKTIVHPSVREEAAFQADQSRVWGAVRAGTTATPKPNAPAPAMQMADIAASMSSEAPTESYEKTYNSRRVGLGIDSFVDEVQKRFAKGTSDLKGERVVGVIIAYGGEVAWSDIFASGDLFNRYWPKLLRSYAVEALARPTLREVASASDASEFLMPLSGRTEQETEPNAYIWRETTSGHLALIELAALEPKPFPIHRLMVRRNN